MKEPRITLGPDLVKLIAEVDEFKGRWEALKTLSPDRLQALRKVATVESVGSSTRIEGANLTEMQVESCLTQLKQPPSCASWAVTADLVAFGKAKGKCGGHGKNCAQLYDAVERMENILPHSAYPPQLKGKHGFEQLAFWAGRTPTRERRD